MTSDGLLQYSSKSDFQIACRSHLQMVYNFFLVMIHGHTNIM